MASDRLGRYRREFENGAVPREIESLERITVIDPLFESEFVETAEADDFIAVARRHDLFPDRVRDMKIELIHAPAYFAFLPPRAGHTVRILDVSHHAL